MTSTITPPAAPPASCTATCVRGGLTSWGPPCASHQPGPRRSCQRGRPVACMGGRMPFSRHPIHCAWPTRPGVLAQSVASASPNGRNRARCRCRCRCRARAPPLPTRRPCSCCLGGQANDGGGWITRLLGSAKGLCLAQRSPSWRAQPVEFGDLPRGGTPFSRFCPALVAGSFV